MKTVNPAEHPERSASVSDGPHTAAGPDPVHPSVGFTPADGATQPPLLPSRSGSPTARPLAAARGLPATLDHRIVALEIGAAVSPVAVHRWEHDREETILMIPVEAQVWARAGRLTLTAHDGREIKLTILAPEEGEGRELGEHWPVGEPDSRARRIATAAARDVGEVLVFPSWFARTARISGERNRILGSVIRRIREVSPETAVHYGQTFGVVHPAPGQHRPYDHRGLVGHEGWPREL